MSEEVKLPHLITELRDVEWKTFGAKLGITDTEIRTIALQYPHDKGRCLIELMDRWMKTTDDVSWAAVAVALKKMFEEPLANRIITRYCIRRNPQTDGQSGFEDPKSIEVSKDVHEELLQLNLDYSEMIKNTRRFISNRVNYSLFKRKCLSAQNDFITYVATFFGVDSHQYSFNEILDELFNANHIFKVTTLKRIVQHHFDSPVSAITTIENYEAKVQNFMQNAQISQLKDKVKRFVSHSMERRCDVLSIILSPGWETCVWKLLEKLMKKVFGVHESICIHPSITTGSIKVQWIFRKEFKATLVELAEENVNFLKENGILKLSIGNQEIFSHSIEDKQDTPDEIFSLVAIPRTCAAVPHVSITNIQDKDVQLIQTIVNADDTNFAPAIASTDPDVPVFERSTSHVIEDETCSFDFMIYNESINPKFIGYGEDADTCSVERTRSDQCKDFSNFTTECPICHVSICLSPNDGSRGDYFQCSHCQHEFCPICFMPFKHGKECERQQQTHHQCVKEELHAHHKRNCLHHLCEFPSARLEKLLTDKHIHFQSHFQTIQSSVGDSCAFGRGCEILTEGTSGLCSYHYKLYLAGLIIHNKLDPAEMSEKDELLSILESEGIPVLKKGSFQSTTQYTESLVEYVKAHSPLDDTADTQDTTSSSSSNYKCTVM